MPADHKGSSGKGQHDGDTMKKSSLCLVFIAVCLPLSNAQSKIASEGVTSVQGVEGKTKLVATFLTSKVDVPRSAESDERARRYVQCTYSRFPCSLTERIYIQIGGTDVFVPTNAYADLGDINTARWSASKSGSTTLTITGGDASESYVAILYFKNKTLSERRLYSGEDMSHALEVSHYY